MKNDFILFYQRLYIQSIDLALKKNLVKQHLESVYRPSAINLIKFLSQGNFH